MHRTTTSRGPRSGYLALMVLGLTLLGLTVAWAQQPVTTGAVPTFSGALLKLHVESPVLLATGSGSSITYRYQPAGRFQIWTDPLVPRGGNPTITGDENRNLASVALNGTFTSKVTVAIDTDATDAQLGYYYDVNELAADQGAEADPADLINYWPVAPVAGSRDIIGEYRLPVAFDDDDNPSEYVRVRQILTVVGDAVQVEYIVYNTSTQRHSIGLRLCFDSLFGGATLQDGAPIVLPDGTQIVAERMIPDPAKPTEIIPDRWVCYDNQANPNVAVRGTLNAYEVTNPGIASRSAGRPSSIAFGQMRNIGLPAQFYFQPNSQASLLQEDWGYAVTWNPVDMAPGESRRFVTYYGVGSSAGDYDPPYAFMAYAPFLLQAAAGDDPETDGITEAYHYTDLMGRSPFPIAAYMDNFGSNPLLDASVRVRLPMGLELASGESLNKSAGTINRNEIKNLTWNVLATAARPGQAEVKFTGPRGKVLTREINIPAVPVLNPLPNSLNGLEMVSVPYEFTNTDAEWVFQSLGSLLPGSPASLIRYNPLSGYKTFPDPYTTNVTPGAGYWLLNRNREVVELPADATPVDTTRSYNLDLRAGWNQIGNPFLVSLRFDQVRVMPSSGGEWSMEEAVSRNVLLPTLYAYDPSVNQYTWELELGDTQMDPYMGYWLLAREDCTLMFPSPTVTAPAQIKPQVTSAAVSGPENWKVAVVVSSPGLPSVSQTLGVRHGAASTLDRYDIPQPPASIRAAQVYLKSAFHAGTSGLGMGYAADTRAPIQAAQEWNLAVCTNASNQPVTVSWPSLTSLPRDLVATLIDPTTGHRQYMRTTTGYSFRTGSQTTDRTLKIVVQPRGSSALSVSGVNTATAGRGGVTISYTLSAEAAVDVRVRNLAGVVISVPAAAQLSSAGANTVLWSGQSTRGTAVPSGRYLCEIVARAPLTGEAVSVVHPVDIRR